MPAEDLIDRDLIHAAKDGDRAAFEALARRHAPSIERVARWITGSAAASEDVAQETLIALFDHLGQVRDPNALRAWLFTIARNLARRHVKRETRESPTDERSLLELGEAAGWGEAGAEEQIARAEDAERVRSAMELLATDDREILILRDVEGLTGDETAEVLGLSRAAMKSRLHRARLRFVAALRGGAP